MTEQWAVVEAIRRAGAQRGLALSDVAREAGVDTETLQAVEAGEHDLTMDLVAGICRALDLPASELTAIAERLEREGRA